jgi:glycosyltransferase involved in cell wall biosynthesis
MKVLKILHLNNVAEVGSILSNQQLISGLESESIDLIKPCASRNIALKIMCIPIRIAHSLFLRAKISLGKYDIVHVHYTTSALLFIGIKPKLIVHAHGSDVRNQDQNILRFFVNKIVFKFSDLIFYSTPDLKKHIDKYGVSSIFIPNPLDIENFVETGRPEHSLFIHAAISQIKGAPVLIEALKKIKQHFPHLKISYLAFGDMLEEIEKLNLNKISKIKRENLKEIISAHGLILGQFQVGAIGMSELEVLSCDRPVVCHFEYDHSYIVPPPLLKARTADEIFFHVESYLNNPEVFLQNKDKYRNWVIENHSKEKIERLVYVNYLTLF